MFMEEKKSKKGGLIKFRQKHYLPWFEDTSLWELEDLEFPSEEDSVDYAKVSIVKPIVGYEKSILWLSDYRIPIPLSPHSEISLGGG